MPEKIREGWHLDKKVPLGLILALFLQTITFVIYLSNLDGRVRNNTDGREVLTREIQDNDKELTLIRINANARSVTLGQIGVQIDNIETILSRIEDRYEREGNRP